MEQEKGLNPISIQDFQKFPQISFLSYFQSSFTFILSLITPDFISSCGSLELVFIFDISYLIHRILKLTLKFCQTDCGYPKFISHSCILCLVQIPLPEKTTLSFNLVHSTGTYLDYLSHLVKNQVFRITGQPQNKLPN